MAALLLHCEIYLTTINFCQMSSEENGFYCVCHYCDYCAIMSFKCRQETFSHDVMNNWVFELYPVAFIFTVLHSKTRLDIQVVSATCYLITYSFISSVYVKQHEVNPIKKAAIIP